MIISLYFLQIIYEECDIVNFCTATKLKLWLIFQKLTNARRAKEFSGNEDYEHIINLVAKCCIRV